MKHQRKQTQWYLILMLGIIALACNFPGAPGETPAPGTTEVTTTPLPFATPTPEAAGTPTTDAVEATATPTEETAAGDDCTYRAAYVADVTIPDDTEVEAGTAFDKTWRIRNSGTCPWMDGTQLTYLSGDKLGDMTEVAVPATPPDQALELTVPMTAPADPGTYRSNWQLQTPDGRRYGGVFYVQIVVPAEATPEPSPEPTEATSRAPAAFFGAVSADCDEVTFAWVDGVGESAYRLDGPGLAVNLGADTTGYTWDNPPEGLSVVTLKALDDDGEAIATLDTTIGVTCDDGEADLVPISITFVPTVPVALLPVTATITIENQGDADSGAFIVGWRSLKTAPTFTCQWTVDEGLETGETATLVCTTGAYNAPYANLVTTVEVDTGTVIAESDEANNILESDTAVVSPETVFDFVANAEIARWFDGPPVDAIPWPSSPDGDQGIVRLTGGTLETGSAIEGMCLQTQPRKVADGILRGEYEEFGSPDYLIEPGDHFVAAVSLLQGASLGDVTYRVMLILSEAGGKWIVSERHTYGEGIETLSADLTPYAGQTASVILLVEAGEDPTDDQACWLRAEIYRYP